MRMDIEPNMREIERERERRGAYLIHVHAWVLKKTNKREFNCVEIC